MTDVLLLGLFSFVVPALFALPLGALVLRLTGVYFVLVTFVLTEITQLVLFETPGWTGGSNGLVGMPTVTFFGAELGDNRAVLLVTIGLALAGAIVTAVVTRALRQHFAAIEENELLARSLELVVWHYKALGFAVAAGVSGLAGFALVNMLLTAHPTSFSPLSSVNYIAYTIIGGKGSMLGPLLGGALLIWAGDLFALRGEYSQFLFGFLIVVVVLAARTASPEPSIALASALLRRFRGPRCGLRPVRSARRPLRSRSNNRTGRWLHGPRGCASRSRFYLQALRRTARLQ